MHIELADLRLFVSIAETGNLTRGAASVSLSAPAASVRIRAMEAQLDVQLLYRSNKGVSLAQSGETLLHHARIILRQVDYLTNDFSSQDHDEKGHIRIAANTTAVTEFMPEVLARFLSSRPKVTIDLQERLTQDIIRSVHNGTADLGIVSGEMSDSGLEVIRFSTDRLMLATPADHALASRKSLSFSETLAFQHISLHEGSTLLAFLRSLLQEHGFDRTLRTKVRSFEAMCRMIEAGVGIGVVPESAARRHAHTMNLALITLNEPWALRERAVVARAVDALPKAARALTAELVKHEVGGAVESSPFPVR